MCFLYFIYVLHSIQRGQVKIRSLRGQVSLYAPCVDKWEYIPYVLYPRVDKWVFMLPALETIYCLLKTLFFQLQAAYIRASHVV